MWIFDNSPVRAMSGVLVGALMAFTSVFAVAVNAQTLFVMPDTSPDFASYGYLEECQNAVVRITDELETRKSPVWWDTMSAEAQNQNILKRMLSRRPDSAITVASICLQRFNADTVYIHGRVFAQYVLDMLLMAHRDEDARRFAQRVLDSMGPQGKKAVRDWRGRLLYSFGHARPVRYEDALRAYKTQLGVEKDDSLYRRVLLYGAMAGTAAMAADTVMWEEYSWLTIRGLDSIPPNDRERLLGPTFQNYAETLLKRLTKREGLDSMAVSTKAYKLWLANSIRARIWGEKYKEVPDEVDMAAVPNLVGEHYYVASGASSKAERSELAGYASQGGVPSGAIPVRGHVNLIYALPSYCHAEGSYRIIESIEKRRRWASLCAPWYAFFRRLKQRFPALEITILSSTYGTVGKLGPLQPGEEADTLAKWWLGWHHIPARLVVEERPFFLVDKPDGRRIDLPTRYADSLHREVAYPYFCWTDQDGVAFELIIDGYYWDAEENMELIEAVIRRGHK